MLRCFKVLILLLISSPLFSQEVKYDEWKNLTTSGKLPHECKIQHSNNNLDIARYKDRYYLAFRTAPTHFASKKTVLYIVSSADLENWTYETELSYGCDLREPRFVVYHDTLSLIFFTGGTHMFKFEPKLVLLCQSAGNKNWSTPKSVNLDGYVPWRMRVLNDTLYLSAYYGRGLYKKSHHSDLRLFSSTTGFNWQAVSKEPQIDVLSAEEGEFIFDSKGDMYSTVRLEGTGALVCKAKKGAMQQWNYKRTKYKYDSALMFLHKDEVYVVARKNADGEMDKVKRRKSEKQGKFRNLLRYSFTKKTTALYKLDKDSLTLSVVADFPSTGDCSYAGISKIDDNTYLLMNYSSDIKGRKKNWISGQLGKTYIYWTRLKLNP
ncbi:MAG: hypothetical protein U0V74_12385 [Chitinophagales bacterium]